MSAMLLRPVRLYGAPVGGSSTCIWNYWTFVLLFHLYSHDEIYVYLVIVVDNLFHTLFT